MVRKKKKNPYAGAGNQRFREVLTDLEEKRKRIFLKLGGGRWVVKFRESASNHVLTPVIFKEQSDGIIRLEKQTMDNNNSDGDTITKSTGDEEGFESKIGEKMDGGKTIVVTNDIPFSYPYRPYCLWWLVLVVFILFCLVTKGRSFAIFCTSVWWYLAPIGRRTGIDHRIRGGSGHGNSRFVGVRRRSMDHG